MNGPIKLRSMSMSIFLNNGTGKFLQTYKKESCLSAFMKTDYDVYKY